MLMSVHRKQWYNDVTSVVANGSIVGGKGGSILIVDTKPLLIDPICKRVVKKEDGVDADGV